MRDRTIVTPYFLERPVPQLGAMARVGWTVNEPVFAGDTAQARLAQAHRPIAAFVAEAIEAGDRPVSIAGDCCAAIGVMAGLQRTGVEATLIWFDAHGDFNTWETTPSGFLGGMPLAMIVGLGELTMAVAVDLEPHPPERVVLTDGRDLDPGERELLDGSDVVWLRDPQALLDQPLPEGPLYIHFDCDVINADEAPAHNYPVPGGPSSADITAIFSRLAGSGQIVAVSMSTWNPDLDEEGRTEAACMACLDALLECSD